MDYRKFLGATQTQVAPWLGGRSLELPGRRLRLPTTPPAPGWYQFELKGRVATPGAPAEPPDLAALPKVRGFVWRDRLVGDGARAERLHLIPSDEPPRFSPVSARRWHGGALLFEQLEFESEVESAVRARLAEGAGLSELKGVPAALRAAFGYALIEQTARRMNVPVTAAELRHHVGPAAEGGTPEAERAVRALVAEREQTERELRELRARLTAAQLRAELQAAREEQVAQRASRQQTAEDRAWEALEKAGADFESSRQAGHGQLEVVFRFMDERFIALVEADTLQVLDSGICLGHPPSDRLLTLDSLPAVIREAIETDALVILREP